MFQMLRLNPDDRQNLQALGVAGQVAHLALASKDGAKDGTAPTSVSLFDQGLIQILQASVTGTSAEAEICACAGGAWRWQRPVAAAGGLHDQSGRIGDRQCGRSDPADRRPVRAADARRYLVIAAGDAAKTGEAVQVEAQ